MRHDVGARLPPHPARTAEVVGMRVRDDDGVDPPQRDACARQPARQHLERVRPGEPGIDDRDAPLVLEDVAVDVPESRHVDGQLASEDPRRDLGDLVARPLLFLLARFGDSRL